ncbi:hypothetical protein LCGC14_0163350 [marine sediment metagenome]|uniref:Uncharacterized protein n=1 Tax=marine sediment metagenome TaxID=412755 RepID=A0A0F9XCG8_9ZZZZ
MAKYNFKKGSRYTKVQKALANDIGQELETIRKDEGGILPEEVLRRAHAKKSPMHSFFTWDNHSAANDHRLEQARLLIRNIEVTIYRKPMGKQEPTVVRAFYTENPTSQGGAYFPTVEILSDADRRANLLAIALQEAEQWRERWKHLDELRIVFDAIDRIKAKRKRGRKAAV